MTRRVWRKKECLLATPQLTTVSSATQSHRYCAGTIPMRHRAWSATSWSTKACRRSFLAVFLGGAEWVRARLAKKCGGRPRRSQAQMLARSNGDGRSQSLGTKVPVFGRSMSWRCWIEGEQLLRARRLHLQPSAQIAAGRARVRLARTRLCTPALEIPFRSRTLGTVFEAHPSAFSPSTSHSFILAHTNAHPPTL